MIEASSIAQILFRLISICGSQLGFDDCGHVHRQVLHMLEARKQFKSKIISHF